MVVQHNMAAMFSNRQLGINDKFRASSTEKLNSGYKINRAADDAAGLSISEKMRWQIRGLNRSAQNIQDGMSYVQVADGALEECQKMLQRMNELCVQAANDTNTDADRAATNDEIQELKTELNRTFETTEFNTQPIWYIDESARVETGTTGNSLKTVSYTATNLSDDSAGLYPYNGEISFSVKGDYITAEWKGLDGNNYSSSKSMERFMMDGTFDFSKLSDGSEGLDFSYEWDVNVDATKENLRDAFNGKIINLDTQASFNTVLTPYEDGLYTGEMRLNYGKIYESYMSTSSDKMDFDNTSASDVAKAFYPTGTTSNLTDKGPSIAPEWSFGFTLNGVGTVTATSSRISYSSATTSNISTSAKIDTLKDWIAEATEPDKDGNPQSPAGAVSISFNLTDSKNTVIGSYSLMISISDDDTADSITSKIQSKLNSQTKLTPGAMDDTEQLPNPTQIQSQTILYDDSISLEIQAGALEDQDITVKYKSLDASRLGIRMLNTKTAAACSHGIEQVAAALETISAQRSLFGAYQNRFEHAYANNTNTAENVQSSESCIRDTDYGKEMVSYSASNIVSQAASAMLSQANTSVQGVLDLLQG